MEGMGSSWLCLLIPGLKGKLVFLGLVKQLIDWL